MDTLVGKTAVVTGGASGMGRAMALRFARAGANVVVADISDDAAAVVVDEAAAVGAGAIAVHTDVSSFEANTALFDAAMAEFGRVNVVCLNAGVPGSAGRSWGLSQQDWDWSLGILLDGVIHGVRAFVPHLVEHGDGHVVVTGSIAGHVGWAFGGPYVVGKHAVVAVAETLYHELRAERSNVGVTCLCPGVVNTNIIASARARAAENPGLTNDEFGAKWLDMSERALAGGLDPEIVGEQVYDAILDNQFWLFTDDLWDEPIMLRAEQITNQLPPTIGRPSEG